MEPQGSRMISVRRYRNDVSHNANFTFPFLVYFKGGGKVLSLRKYKYINYTVGINSIVCAVVVIVLNVPYRW